MCLYTFLENVLLPTIGEKNGLLMCFNHRLVRLIKIMKYLTTKAKAKHFLNQNMNQQKARIDLLKHINAKMRKVFT
jgi:hypothetical protein